MRAENQERLALAALANLMGADPDAQFSLDEGDAPQAKTPAAYRDGLVLALELRPELKSARRQVERAALAVDQARAGYLPSLDAQGRVYLDAPTPASWKAKTPTGWRDWCSTGISQRPEHRGPGAGRRRRPGAHAGRGPQDHPPGAAGS